jgi:hypothetical protein
LEDVNLLKDILTYHAVAFEIPPSFLSAIKLDYLIPTVQGSVPVRIDVYRENGAITFDPVKVKYETQHFSISSKLYQKIEFVFLVFTSSDCDRQRCARFEKI